MVNEKIDVMRGEVIVYHRKDGKDKPFMVYRDEVPVSRKYDKRLIKTMRKGFLEGLQKEGISEKDLESFKISLIRGRKFLKGKKRRMIYKKRVRLKGSIDTLTVIKEGHERKGYYKPSVGKRIPPTKVKRSKPFKIKDVGAKGRGISVIPIKRKGALRQLGYSSKAPVEQRRKALRKAVNKYGGASVFRMLNAQVIYRKRKRDGVKSAFIEDRDYVENQLMTDREKVYMTSKARKEWVSMTPRERAIAMPNRTRRRKLKV